jgi:hypothetical protein
MMGEGKRKIKLLFNIQVGAGLPSNKALAYNYILEAYKGGLLSKKETRELMMEYIKLPVETVDNKVIELEEKQIDYQSMMLDSQMKSMQAQLNAPTGMPAIAQSGNMEGINEMQEEPIQRNTEIQNPRPNTLNTLSKERNIV